MSVSESYTRIKQHNPERINIVFLVR